MTAGDTKKVIVIRNISSDLIEEAILILKNENAAEHEKQTGKMTGGTGCKNDSILKEAERIINEYIHENNLTLAKAKKRKIGMRSRKNTVGMVINILLAVAAAFLFFAVGWLLS